MTTKVIISVPEHTHKRARVTVLMKTDQQLWAPIGNPVDIDKGGEEEFLIHGTQSLEIEEIE
jgi:hypothetical protein